MTALVGTGVAPRPLDPVTIDGRPGLVMERLHGVDMLALLAKRPWRLVALGRALAEATRRIHDVAAPSSLPALADRLRERINAADLAPQLHTFALGLLESLPAGDRLCHGDLHPGNAVVTADGVRVIDWPGATRGTPAADYARTLLLLRQADPLPDTPLFLRLLISTGRPLFALAFVRSYGRTLSDVPQWTAVQAAARLIEVPTERDRLLAIVERAYRNASPGSSG